MVDVQRRSNHKPEWLSDVADPLFRGVAPELSDDPRLAPRAPSRNPDGQPGNRRDGEGSKNTAFQPSAKRPPRTPACPALPAWRR